MLVPATSNTRESTQGLSLKRVIRSALISLLAWTRRTAQALYDTMLDLRMLGKAGHLCAYFDGLFPKYKCVAPLIHCRRKPVLRTLPCFLIR